MTETKRSFKGVCSYQTQVHITVGFANMTECSLQERQACSSSMRGHDQPLPTPLDQGDFLWHMCKEHVIHEVHSKKKSTSEHLFWCFRLSQIEASIEYLEGPNSTWKDHDRNLGVQIVPGRTTTGILGSISPPCYVSFHYC